MAPSSVKRRINELECRRGARLLTRNKRELDLTEAGDQHDATMTTVASHAAG
ncbi:MAG: helix-turn-helix domain-containing protein [Hyphomicrobiaceae bacterium]